MKPNESGGPTGFRWRWGGSCTATPELAALSGVAVQLPPQRARREAMKPDKSGGLGSHRCLLSGGCGHGG